MWKSRIDKFPPSQFYADLFQHLRNLFPGAVLDANLTHKMRDIWTTEWRYGQNAQDTAKATCSCDGKTIIPSPGAGRDLGKRLARPPQGAKRGDLVTPEALREVAPLSSARQKAETLAKAFDRVRAVTLKLLKAPGWTPKKQAQLEKLKGMLVELKRKHDATVAQYESVQAARSEAKQPALYTKPLGALGLSLRPEELPPPPPSKAKKLPKEKQVPKPRKSVVNPIESNSKKGDCRECAEKKHPSIPPPTQPAQAESRQSQPKREAKKRVGHPAEEAQPQQMTLLSDKEAEELANLFAAASAEDKSK